MSQTRAEAYRLFTAGEHARCEALLRRALARPGPEQRDAYLLGLMGAVLTLQRRATQAVHYYERAIEAAPGDAQARANFGNTLVLLGRLDDAESHLREAIRLDPAHASAYHGLGAVLERRWDIDGAVEAGRAACRLAPNDPGSWHNLASALMLGGFAREALKAAGQALRLAPGRLDATCAYLMGVHYLEDATAAAIFEEHRRLAPRIGLAPALAAAPAMSGPAAGGAGLDPQKRLRVGLLSSDLRRHPVGAFIEALVAHRDRARVELLGYHNGFHDAASDRFKERLDGWCDATALDDAALLTRLRRDGLDVIVDLNGLSDGTRVHVLTRRAAPVQVTYIGYPNTTGLPNLDARLVDDLTDPPGASDARATERLVRLGRCFLAYTPPEDLPELDAGAEVDGPGGGPGGEARGFAGGSAPRLACFGSAPKINPPLLRAWAEILRAVPGATLLLKNRGLVSPRRRSEIMAVLAEAGVGAERVSLRGWEPSPAHHLAEYRGVDLALDTFPYHGTTTTCEALWMGVPVVTRAGEGHVSRVGLSLLTAAGLGELVADSARGYVDLAVGLLREPGRLAEMRRGLRGRVSASALGDGPGLARAVEAALRGLWVETVRRALGEAGPGEASSRGPGEAGSRGSGGEDVRP